MKVLLIDNYDSFTYNLYQFLGELGAHPQVYRNDAVDMQTILSLNPSHIVISPGPGDPRDEAYFGICTEVITTLGKSIPLLGVCLGHQGIGHIFGAEVVRASQIMHGKTSLILHNSQGLFDGIPTPIEVMRYHSLILSPSGFPDVLEITAKTEEGVVMALKHKQYPISGTQFHPESVGTKMGKRILKNFLEQK